MGEVEESKHYHCLDLFAYQSIMKYLLRLILWLLDVCSTVRDIKDTHYLTLSISWRDKKDKWNDYYSLTFTPNNLKPLKSLLENYICLILFLPWFTLYVTSSSPHFTDLLRFCYNIGVLDKEKLIMTWRRGHLSLSGKNWDFVS